MYKAVSRSDGDLIILACMNRANGIEWEHPCLLEKKRECNYEENEEDPVWHVKTSRSLKSYNMGEGRKKQSLSRDEHWRAWSTHHGGPNRIQNVAGFRSLMFIFVNTKEIIKLPHNKSWLSLIFEWSYFDKDIKYYKTCRF